MERCVRIRVFVTPTKCAVVPTAYCKQHEATVLLTARTLRLERLNHHTVQHSAECKRATVQRDGGRSVQPRSAMAGAACNRENL